MDMGEGSSHLAVDSTRDTIQVGCTLLLRLPSGDMKTWKLEKDSTANLGKFGSFYANELIGQPYGLTYEIVDKRLKVVPPRTLQEVEDTDATNELIDDGQFVQPLTAEEIQALRKAGVHASEIIKRQIEQHANYQLKTEYSKEKYKKRKEAKYSKSFTVIDPTMLNVCEYWFSKDQNRLRDIRPDALSQMLNMANVRPGGRYLVVDDASGVVVAGVLERLGGTGRLITICDVDSPPAYPVVVHMNFRKEIFQVMSSLNWATADEEYTPILAPSEPPAGMFKSDAQRSRLNKRKIASDSLTQARNDLFAGEFEALIVASEYDPYSILEKLSLYLAGSAPIVVHSPHIQVVADLQNKLRDCPQYLGPSVTELWTRRYQVLPGRTHPLMNMSGSGGFILQTTQIFDDPAASPVMAHRHKAKKAKVEGDTTETTSSTANTTAVSTPSPDAATAIAEEKGASEISDDRTASGA